MQSLEKDKETQEYGILVFVSDEPTAILLYKFHDHDRCIVDTSCCHSCLHYPTH